MKKLRTTTILLGLLAMLASCASPSQSISSEPSKSEVVSRNYDEIDYSEYYHAVKWIFFLYCWQIEDGSYMYGALRPLSSSSPCHSIATIRHIQNCIPCPGYKMSEILKTTTVEIMRESWMFLIPYPITAEGWWNYREFKSKLSSEERDDHFLKYFGIDISEQEGEQI